MVDYVRTTGKSRRREAIAKMLKLDQDIRTGKNLTSKQKLMPMSARPSRLRKDSGRPVDLERGKLRVSTDVTRVKAGKRINKVETFVWNPTAVSPMRKRLKNRAASKRARVARRMSR